MADITSSLFPEAGGLFQQQYLQAQQAGQAASDRAMGSAAQFATSAAANMAGFGGNLLGSSIGRALGGTTPEEDQAKAVKAIAAELVAEGKNPQTSEGMSIMVQRLNSKGLFQAAQKAQAAATTLREKEVKSKQEEAQTRLYDAQTIKAGREQVAADPVQQLLRTGKYTPESIAEYAQTGKGLQLVEKQTALPEIAKLQQYKAGLTDPKAIAEVDAIIKAAGEGKKSTTNVNVAVKDSAGVAGLVGKMQENVKPYTLMVDAADQAMAYINEAKTGQNPQAWSQAVTSVASLVQGGRISNQDIQRAGGDPAILSTIKDYVSGKITGLPSENTMKNLYIVAALGRKIAAEKRQGVVKDQQRVGKAAGLDDQTIGSIFQEPSAPATKKSGKTASGISYSYED